MPREKKTKAAAQPEFENDFTRMAANKEDISILLSSMHSLAIFFDEVISGKNVWITIGRNKRTHRLLFTLHGDDEDEYAGGSNLREFLAEFNSL